METRWPSRSVVDRNGTRNGEHPRFAFGGFACGSTIWTGYNQLRRSDSHRHLASLCLFDMFSDNDDLTGANLQATG